jgi:Spy/CpxP family protein refolding chaperone
MEIKMKTVSNIAAAAALALVLVSFILNAAKIACIDMNDALKAGGFIKAVFLPVDASVWINNIFGRQGSGGGIIQRDESNK